MTETGAKRPMAPPPGGAAVRMYCTGLGDCFLLGVLGDDAKRHYILIDCGVWKGTSGAKDWMCTIMQHIAEEVDGVGIDLLVATHAHWDHLSGFHQAQEIFRDIKVRQVWLPWTENPEDTQALKMVEERRTAYRAAVAAVSRLQGAEHLEALLQCREDDPLAARPTTTDDLLEIVRTKVEKPDYVLPSLVPRVLGNLPDLRIYPLGPPTDLKLLGRDDPSTTPGKSEVYLAASFNENEALEAAASPRLASDLKEQAKPFDPSLSRFPDDLEHAAFFQTLYRDVSDRAPEWRRIDTDWLEVAGQLALDLDDHVNNTSLALAFELGANGPVLLFPGDAQVGNWLSWHKLPDGPGGLTAESLLRRTVFYKVGHHASHNATLKDQGLKMMTDNRRLVAMVPVDEDEARKPKGSSRQGWAMPYDKLLTDLEKRTEGRIARADRGVENPEARKQFTVERVSFEGKDKILFIEHTVRP